MSLRIEKVADGSMLANMAVQRVEALASAALRERGRFVAVTSGDALALAVCRAWAERGNSDFARVVMVLADENAVPLADPRSRRAALDAALTHRLAARGLALPEVMAIDGESGDRAHAAGMFDQMLRAVLPSAQTDLVILGMGTQGEFAGLAPGDDALKENAAWCVGSAREAAGTGRYTLTLPFLLRSRAILLLAAGADRASALQVALQGRLDPERVPAQFFLRDERLPVTLVADEASRAQLKQS